MPAAKAKASSDSNYYFISCDLKCGMLQS